MIGKNWFLGVPKKYLKNHWARTCLLWHTKVPKNKFSQTWWQLLMVPLSQTDHNLPKTIILEAHWTPTCLFWHTKVLKNQFSLTQWQLLMVPLWSWDWKLTKTRETTHIKWILNELELIPINCLFSEFFTSFGKTEILERNDHSSLDIHFRWGIVFIPKK